MAAGSSNSRKKMATQDTSELKGKIISILRRRGPSLPVHIAGETGLSILFASAFLSELISERKIKISNMRIGSSPIYFLPNQEYLLEKFSSHLKSKEKDAYTLLREKKFLSDSEQDPAIRVALRSIKDFAVGFQKNGKIFWRYYTIPESEFKEPERKISPAPIKKIAPQIASQEKKPEEIKTKPKELNIFEEVTKKPKKKSANKKQVSKKTSQKKDDKFFNRVKEFLTRKAIEIIDIESFNKEDLILRIKIKEREKLLIAYNKKRVNEQDIIKASKKAQELNLPFIILSLGGPLKRLENLIDAVKSLDSMEKL